MQSVTEGTLRFDFAWDWEVSVFDEWSFYKGQFARIGDAEIFCNNCTKLVRCKECNSRRVAGTKGIDILALSPEGTCWLIEIKDYRMTRETAFDFLADVVALKVRDTHACMAAARLRANDESERSLAETALNSTDMKVVLHLEMPPPHSPLINPTTQRANVLQRLKQLVRAVDFRPLVVSQTNLIGVPWAVTQL